MSPPIIVNTLRGLRWQVTWYGIGLALYAAFMIWLFPIFEGAFATVAAEYPPEIMAFFGASGDLANPRVFIQVEYFSFAPIILVIYGTMAGTGLLASDEGRGTLKPLLAQPISRTSIFFSRLLALVAGLFLILAVNALGWILSVPFIDLGDTGLLSFLGATLVAIPLVMTFAGLGLLVASISPTRGSAGGILAVLAIVAYLISSFALAIEAISWMRWLSPYFYSDSHRLLTEGIVWWHQGVLTGLAVLSVTLGWLGFCGREIAAGVWQPRAIMRGWDIVLRR
ncbi:MAG: ABC transporter permease subunit [Chloroflexi bacterium]|nr:ABC transporter permease subunit [Chloroflexota bacterium]MQC47727.1 hypothetical protein [Chloroflexota bacterium]